MKKSTLTIGIISVSLQLVCNSCTRMDAFKIKHIFLS